jgi:hypothetical protein
VNLPRARRPTPAWTLLEPRFDGEGRIPLVDEQGNCFLLGRSELREALVEGAPVNSVSGFRLDVTHLDEGRLL